MARADWASNVEVLGRTGRGSRDARVPSGVSVALSDDSGISRGTISSGRLAACDMLRLIWLESRRPLSGSAVLAVVAPEVERPRPPRRDELRDPREDVGTGAAVAAAPGSDRAARESDSGNRLADGASPPMGRARGPRRQGLRLAAQQRGQCPEEQDSERNQDLEHGVAFGGAGRDRSRGCRRVDALSQSERRLFGPL